jgi:menaquinol-cytochrome c reductase cytochrome b/c subunit
MAEVPEHLLKRAAERKAALAAKKAAEGSGGDAPPTDAEGGAPEDPDKIPARLLTGGGGGGGGGTATATAPAPRTTAPPPGTGVAGPAGHTQRLLTVVKAGSIQDVKATPTDKVHTWPHLLVVEFVAALAMTAFLLVFSAFVNAPLLGMANPNLTPNPSKAPWYFLGLQELLTMFHPMVAGVTIPGIGLIVMGAAGYIDKNPSNKPEDRKFAIGLMTIFLMFWAVLVIIGSFFRGEGFNFIMPWHQGVHEIFDL